MLPPIFITEEKRPEVLELTEDLMLFLHNKASGDISFAASLLAAILIYRGHNNLELDIDLINEACWWIDSQDAGDSIN